MKIGKKNCNIDGTEIVMYICLSILLTLLLILVIAGSVSFVDYCSNKKNCNFEFKTNDHCYFADSYEVEDTYICFTDTDNHLIKLPKEHTEIVDLRKD